MTIDFCKVILDFTEDINETYEIAFAETIVSKIFTIELIASITVPFFSKSNPS